MESFVNYLYWLVEKDTISTYPLFVFIMIASIITVVLSLWSEKDVQKDKYWDCQSYMKRTYVVVVRTGDINLPKYFHTFSILVDENDPLDEVGVDIAVAKEMINKGRPYNWELISSHKVYKDV